MTGSYNTADLRQAREYAGLTQREAAGVCFVNIRTYQRWESGETKRVPWWVSDQIVAAGRKSRGG